MSSSVRLMPKWLVFAAATVLCLSRVFAEVSSTVLLSAYPANNLIVGETLTITCTVVTDGGSSPVLTYEVWRGNSTVSTTPPTQATSQTLSLGVVSTEHSGTYKCVVTLPPSQQWESAGSQITVQDQKPTLSVSPAGGQAYTEDTVLLPCGLQSNQSQNQNHERWKYYWYRGSQSAYPLEQIWDGGGGEAVLRLWRSRASDTGQYWCRAGRGQPTFYTEFSDPVYVNITDFFRSVTLSVSPGVNFRANHPLRITCLAQVSQRHAPASASRRAQKVTYTFYKNGQPYLSDTPHYVVTAERAVRGHAGRYACSAASGRAQRTSPEVHLTADDTSMVLVISVGTSLLIIIPLAAYLIQTVFPNGFGTRTTGRESVYQITPT
ncbi:uncharacterized protein LOC134448504 isoform X2 [Engraulis encrasicolus]|uniref:uncharacterized protein LOC134448504 isoform X2 n=1 Tax=Engraulis encrasicolus TaxID=184585 RepID=UPI002FD43C6B